MIPIVLQIYSLVLELIHLKSCLNIHASNQTSANDTESSTPTVDVNHLQNLGWISTTDTPIADVDPLQKNIIWKLIDRFLSNNTINYHWVYKVKHKEDGSVERFMARLFANGM